jgi:tetratricopeptide (TPR) repeat protein
MKTLTLTCFFICFLSSAFAQNNTGTDTALKFNERVTRCERKWVVISKKDTDKYYAYGFVYVDLLAGFTFDLKGRFSVDKDNRYIADTSVSKNGPVKYRIAPNWRYVALLPLQHFKELNISPQPAWLKIYYNPNDTGSAHYNYRLGFAYNAAGDCEGALPFLNKAWNANPQPDGVAFEMAYAFNGLNQFERAIKILIPAVQAKPGDPLLYKELAYAYAHKNDYDDAIATYKKGLELFPDRPSDEKGEMCLNLANVYRVMGNQEEYKNWMIKAKSFAPPNSGYYKQIVAAGF